MNKGKSPTKVMTPFPIRPCQSAMWEFNCFCDQPMPMQVGQAFQPDCFVSDHFDANDDPRTVGSAWKV